MRDEQIRKRLEQQVREGDHNARVLLDYFSVPKAVRRARRQLAINRYRERVNARSIGIGFHWRMA